MRLGASAEDAVARHLQDAGYTIVARNARVGRYELDIIATKGRLLVVCEVRARTHARPIHPAHTLTPKKLNNVRKAASRWLSQRKGPRVRLRIDAAAVTQRDGQWVIAYYENVSMPTRALS